MSQRLQKSTAYVQDWSDPQKMLDEIIEHNERIQKLGEGSTWYEDMLKRTEERKIELARREAVKAAKEAEGNQPAAAPQNETPAPTPSRSRRGTAPASPVSPGG